MTSRRYPVTLGKWLPVLRCVLGPPSVDDRRLGSALGFEGVGGAGGLGSAGRSASSVISWTTNGEPQLQRRTGLALHFSICVASGVLIL